jgi:hypothetical protein
LQLVSGFIGEDGDVMNPKPFNIKAIPALFTKGEKNKYSLMSWMLLENLFQTLSDMDSLTLRADADLERMLLF